MPSSFPTAEIGQFVVTFQAIEAHLSEVIVALTGADDEYVYVLLSELEYNSRARAADVIFTRFVALSATADPASPAIFHKLMVVLQKLGERRNELVHSNYHFLVATDGTKGLARSNFRLRPSKGTRERQDEDLFHGSLSVDQERLGEALSQLEAFRLKIIQWKYPAS